MDGIRRYLRKFDAVLLFLLLECLALTAFALGGINVIFSYLGFIVALPLIPFVILFSRKKENLEFLYIAVPLLVLAAFVSFGSPHAGLAAENVGLFLGLGAFLFLGYAARRIPSFKIGTGLLCIGAALAILVLISNIASWSAYGLFHTLIYRNTPIYYYHAETYDVTAETRWLSGFSFNVVSLRYAGLYDVMLMSALPALLYIHPKKEWRKFLVAALIGGIGLVSALTAMNLYSLAMALPIAAIALLYRFLPRGRKLMKALGYVVLAVFIIAVITFLFALLNAVGVRAISEPIAANHFLNRLFNANRVMADINAVLKAAFEPANLLGFGNSQAIFADTGSFEFEVIKDGGILAFLVLLAFLVFVVLGFSSYLRRSRDGKVWKIVLLSFLGSFFLYATFAFDAFPLRHEPEAYMSFYRSLPLFIVLFVIGYAFYPLSKKTTLLIEDDDFVRAALRPEKEETERGAPSDEYTFTEPLDEEETGGKEDEER